MDPELELIVGEDEAARAMVEAAAARAQARVEHVRADLARARQERLDELARDVDATVASIHAEAAREAAARRARRDAWERERNAAAAASRDQAVEMFVAIVTTGEPPRGRS